MVQDTDLIQLAQTFAAVKPPPRAPGGVTGKVPVKRKLPENKLTPTQQIQSMFSPEEVTSNVPPFSY